jgi:serine/threonine protein kinase
VSNLPDFLGPYRLAKFIRAGNSCQIWEAIQGDGKTRCVLKVLRREHWGNREEIGYLKHEYDVAHGLEHPSVIEIMDFNTEGKIAYLVLEIFAILNLKQALRADPEQALYFFQSTVEQCLSGLHALHEAKWVHLDVKPDNFLFNDDGRIKLIDFTIAQRPAKGLGRLFSKRGKIRGTRSYMSPEQIRGKPLDARSDIYSFGCVMYELLTNKLPYTGISPDDLLNKHLKAAIPVVQVHNNNVTNDLTDLIRRMMAKDAENRPPTMEDVLKEFRSMRSFKTAPKRPDTMPDQSASQDDAKSDS